MSGDPFSVNLSPWVFTLDFYESYTIIPLKILEIFWLLAGNGFFFKTYYKSVLQKNKVLYEKNKGLYESYER